MYKPRLPTYIREKGLIPWWELLKSRWKVSTTSLKYKLSIGWFPEKVFKKWHIHWQCRHSWCDGRSIWNRHSHFPYSRHCRSRLCSHWLLCLKNCRYSHHHMTRRPLHHYTNGGLVSTIELWCLLNKTCRGVHVLARLLFSPFINI